MFEKIILLGIYFSDKMAINDQRNTYELWHRDTVLREQKRPEGLCPKEKPQIRHDA